MVSTVALVGSFVALFVPALAVFTGWLSQLAKQPLEQTAPLARAAQRPTQRGDFRSLA